MGVSGFPSQGMPLNSTDPAYFEHVSYVFFLYFSACAWDCPLWRGIYQSLKSSFYWPSETIQSLSSLNQENKLILVSGNANDQRSIDPSSYLYNPLHKISSTLYPNPSTTYEHLTTSMVCVYISSSWFGLFVVAPMDPNFILVQNIVSPPHKRNYNWINPLLDSTNIPNTY